MSDIDAIRTKHVRWGHPDGRGGHCMGCKHKWPCDTRVVLDALDEMEDRAVGNAYQAATADLDRDAARADADRLAEALLPVQWSYADDIGNYDCCPTCLAYAPKHKADCSIGEALRQHDEARSK